MLTKILDAVINICKKSGRFRIILDRDGKTPYLERYYIFLQNRKPWFPFNVVIHKILLSDLDDLHDHPWPYATLILRGGYWEHTPEGRFWRAPGWFTFRKATALHRLELDPNKECWTMFFMGKRCRDWGFMRNGTWVEAEQYLRERGLAAGTIMGAE